MKTRLVCYVLPIIAGAMSLVSCATGPSYSQVRDQMPPIPKGHGRVIVYRPSLLALEMQPRVKVDGNPVGVSLARGFFYSDQPAGTHQLSILSGWKDEITVSAYKGRNSYVRCEVLAGLGVPRIRPTQVDEMTGEAGLQGCRLTR